MYNTEHELTITIAVVSRVIPSLVRLPHNNSHVTVAFLKFIQYVIQRHRLWNSVSV